MKLASLLQIMVKNHASDLFVSVDAPPCIKIEGNVETISRELLSSESVHELIYSVLSSEQISLFESTSELNFALRIKELGRFRVNVFREMGEIALVARYIKSEIPSIEELKLPVLLKQLVMKPRGLILLVGGTGTGKSTTLASMIDYRNSHKTGHILSIEDPIEFVHEYKKSLVHQREVGLDTESYSVALKNAMREAPDVIMIGEIRDVETMKSAIVYAETGHLCLSTLHANNANQAIDRILNFFPDDSHKQILQDLSMNLRAIVSQRLPRGIDGKRIAAVEVMTDTPYIKELISKGDIGKLKEAMVQGNELGCQTFDDALFTLVEQEKLTEDEALLNADSTNNLALRFRLEGHYSETVSKIKKEVKFSRFVNFNDYSSYRVQAMKVDENAQDRMIFLEKGIRSTLFRKGLSENLNDPDIEVRYFISLKNVNDGQLHNIDSPISSGVNLAGDLQKYGIFSIGFFDIMTGKLIWQVQASCEFLLQVNSQVDINHEVDYLLDEFPPQ